VNGYRHTPAALFPGNVQYPLNKRLGGTESGYEQFVDEKNLLLLPGFEPRTVQPVA
jgi:hypothetical protein